MAIFDLLKYPSVGFHFIVRFIGIVDGISLGPITISPADIDTRWTEVTGLNVELTTEELVEGGENRFTHKLPQRAKYGNLVLKRGFFSSLPSPLMSWAENAINNLDIKPCQVQVLLLDEMHLPAKCWNFIHAYPVKISMGDLKATDSGFLIESIELTYQYYKKQGLLDMIGSLSASF